MLLTASDRSSLLRLASSLPKGSEERRAILAGLSLVSMEFSSQEALDQYLWEHPKADKSLHTVKKKEDSPKKKEDSPKKKEEDSPKKKEEDSPKKKEDSPKKKEEDSTGKEKKLPPPKRDPEKLKGLKPGARVVIPSGQNVTVYRSGGFDGKRSKLRQDQDYEVVRQDGDDVILRALHYSDAFGTTSKGKSVIVPHHTPFSEGSTF